MSEKVVIPWQEVTPLPRDLNGTLSPLLASVDALRSAWEESLSQVSKEDFDEARRRSLRRHAIETGLIERLYDVSWGVTEALVAEGLTLEVAAREGGISEDALATIQTQFDALTLLSQAARDGQEVTSFFIRELHAAITRHQQTYEGVDALGTTLRRPLQHGQWKQGPNHVVRPDGSELQYTPPEHVQSEIDRLVELNRQATSSHSLVQAAWLHHRFITIHPFEDGNGRVARALVLLVLLSKNYAPLVVPARRRDDYLRALDAANSGDLTHLIRLFSELEIVALRSELERPSERITEGAGAVDLARLFAEKLRDRQERTDRQRAESIAALASAIHERLQTLIHGLGEELRSAFLTADPNAWVGVIGATPPADEARYWSAQLIRTARGADFFTNLSDGTWWVRLALTVYRQQLRYVAAIQKVGHGETGVLAVTAFAELVPPRAESDDERPDPTPLLDPLFAESVTIVHTDSAADRWEDVRELVASTLAAAVAEFGRSLG